jgi:hypothetical protein
MRRVRLYKALRITNEEIFVGDAGINPGAAPDILNRNASKVLALN